MSAQDALAPGRDPESVRSFLRATGPYLRLWHRPEAHGLENVPDGPSLLVGNHSGGMFAMDFPLLALHWAEHFGVERPLYLLAHNILFGTAAVGDPLRRIGLIPATPENARKVLGSGAPLWVFPGGDYDAVRPTSKRNVIDFAGRTGYVRTALKADVPIVPVVSIGGHENQLILTRGDGLARRLGLRSRLRVSALPISFGFPFGPAIGTVLPLNMPLPTKIVTRILEPVHIRAEFGADPEPAVVDAHVRKLMQAALDDLARQRRFPVIG